MEYIQCPVETPDDAVLMQNVQSDVQPEDGMAFLPVFAAAAPMIGGAISSITGLFKKDPAKEIAKTEAIIRQKEATLAALTAAQQSSTNTIALIGVGAVLTAGLIIWTSQKKGQK